MKVIFTKLEMRKKNYGFDPAINSIQKLVNIWVHRIQCCLKKKKYQYFTTLTFIYINENL